MSNEWFYFLFFGIAALAAHQWNRIHQFFAWAFGVLAIMFAAHTVVGDHLTRGGSAVADGLTHAAKVMWAAV